MTDNIARGQGRAVQTNIVKLQGSGSDGGAHGGTCGGYCDVQCAGYEEDGSLDVALTTMFTFLVNWSVFYITMTKNNYGNSLLCMPS